MLHIKQKLGRLVNGKNVIFVGPSPSLNESSSGERINGFDVVIRTNDSFDIPPENWDDYGSRCDVLYLNNEWLRRNFIKNKNKQHLLNVMRTIVYVNCVKLIIVKGKKAKNLITRLIKKTFPKLNYTINIEVTSYNWAKKREFWLKNFGDEIEDSFYEPTQISYILSDLSLTRPQETFITGIDFYSGTKHWMDYYNKSLNQKSKSLERKKLHNAMCDKEYLKYQMEKNKVKIDPVISNILSN